MKNIIKIDKNITIDIYNNVKNSLKDKDDFEELLDDRLIDELFSREIVRYLSKTHVLEPNDFKRVDCIMEDNTIKKISFGLIKKTQDSPIKLTYGVI